MGSLFAKIMHMASGPVRPIREWSIVRFVLLAMFWAAATLIVGFWCLFYDNSGVFKSFEDVVCWIGGNLKSPMSILRPLALLGGMVLGGGHYLILRALPFESRLVFRSAEKWITLSALALLSIVPACQVRWWFRARDLYVRVCLSGDGIWSDLKVMESGGDYEAMVARMERSCFAFQSAKAELGDWFIPRQPSGSGTSYLFTTLVGLHGDPFQLNSPDSLTSYLCEYEAGPHGPTAPKSSEPLAKAMVKSEIPIIHMTGLWWLNQRNTLAMEARELSDRGDPSFAAWKDAMTF
ncbi:hypothetical protein [Haloferula sp. BvORR071]|uniref:hypothetical protein n=1 Tax=Haloferula sp. BvORR071 TaxID=1396141 RepID=UPI00055323CB|nr:hypothetical protein [Haloferula sp. BvORR071]